MQRHRRQTELECKWVRRNRQNSNKNQGKCSVASEAY